MGDQLEGSEEEHMKYRAMVVEYIVVCNITFFFVMVDCNAIILRIS